MHESIEPLELEVEEFTSLGVLKIKFNRPIVEKDDPDYLATVKELETDCA